MADIKAADDRWAVAEARWYALAQRVAPLEVLAIGKLPVTKAPGAAPLWARLPLRRVRWPVKDPGSVRPFACTWGHCGHVPIRRHVTPSALRLVDCMHLPVCSRLLLPVASRRPQATAEGATRREPQGRRVGSTQRLVLAAWDGSALDILPGLAVAELTRSRGRLDPHARRLTSG